MEFEKKKESSEEIPEETTPSTASPPFTEEEQRHINLLAEVLRRSLPAVAPQAAVQAPQNVAPEPDDEWEDDDEDIPQGQILYPPTRRHIFWLIHESAARILYGILGIVLTWVLVYLVPFVLFTAQYVNEHAAIESLIGAGVTLVICLVVFFMELRNIVLWRTWKLEVTSTAIQIGQSGNGFLAIDEDLTSFKRSGGEIVDPVRKWYFKLFGLNIYTVSFDSPSQMDEKFKNLTFIKNGNMLKDIFN